MSRIVVTGGGGQVGRALRRFAPEMTILDRARLDVTDGAAVGATLKGSDVVVHLAALTAVDACEEDPDSATRINVEGTRNVVDAIAQTGARIIFLSTDYVFDGRKTEPYVETDEPHPLNVYGRTKFEGERIVAGSPRSLILRVSWVYGEGSNFIRTILDAASNTHELRVVDDQIGRPTAATDIATAVVDAIGAGISGLIHFTGDGVPGSWADLAEYVLGLTGSHARVIRVDSDIYAMGASKPIATRPANSVLALDMARRANLRLYDWRERVAAYVADLEGNRR